MENKYISKAAGLKEIASTHIDGKKEELFQVSSEIWKNPELAFKEYKAHELLTNFLEKEGFTVDRSYTGIETAFRATFGSGRPNVCVISEYDALPGIGHACGHNLIAEAGIAAGLGLKAVLESSNAPKGTVTVMGTPAEEGGGGKVYLLENGAFSNVDVAMMVHPAPYSILKTVFVACIEIMITFTTEEVADPAVIKGNALDAAVLAYNSISHLRQQMKSTCSIHGVITEGGSDVDNTPTKVVMEYYIRGLARSDTQALYKRATACFEAAASASGCTVTIEETSKSYDNMNSNPLLAELYLQNVQALGAVDIQETLFENGSTDMGNISYAVPSIHPMYKIGTGEKYHTQEFNGVTNTPEAHSTTLQWAKAMAHTCIDVIMEDGLLEKIKLLHESQ